MSFGDFGASSVDWGSVDIPTFSGPSNYSFPSVDWSAVSIPTLQGPELTSLAGASGLTYETPNTILPASSKVNLIPGVGYVNPAPTPSPTDIKYGAPTSGGGDNAGSTFAKYAQPVAASLGGIAALAQIPLGVASLNVSRQGQRALTQGAQTANAAAQPALAAESQLMPAGTKALLGGGLPANLQMQVDTQVEQAKNAMLQQLVNQGIDPATAEAMIAEQVANLKNNLEIQMAQSLLTGGSAAASGAVWGAGTTGQLGGQELNTANQAIYGANNSLARLSGMV